MAELSAKPTIRMLQAKKKGMGIILAGLCVASAGVTVLAQMALWDDISRFDIAKGLSYAALAVMAAYIYIRQKKLDRIINAVYILVIATVSIMAIISAVRHAPNLGAILFPLLLLLFIYYEVLVRRLISIVTEYSSNQQGQPGPVEAAP